VKDLVTTLQQKSDKHLVVRIRSCFRQEKKILLKATTTQEDCEFQEEEKKNFVINSLEVVGGRNLMDRKHAIHYERLFYIKEKL
jgi:hypothetical protein